MTTLSIDDAFRISSTYSEKSGRSGSIKLTDECDMKLYMYLGWIIYQLCQCKYEMFFGIRFIFNEFIRCKIEGNPGAPRPTGGSICIAGDCLF